ncbi:MAG: copper-binding protein [Thermoanaerobaculia bacterium]
MKRATLLLVILFFVACVDEKPRPLSEPGEKLYPIRGVIVTRSTGDNSLRLNHEAIAGFMAAMTMDFSVRGADVKSLPADGTRIEAQLHVTDRAFWITDVKQVP